MRNTLLAIFLLLVFLTPSLSAELRLLSPKDGESCSLLPPAQSRFLWPGDPSRDAYYQPVQAKFHATTIDETSPNPVHFSWEWSGEESAVFSLQVSTDLQFGAEETRTLQTNQTSAELVNLMIGTVYYWRVCATTPQETICSEIGDFQTLWELPRWISVPKVYNFRDAGGWSAEEGMRVRLGMIYRGCESDAHRVLFPEGKETMIHLLKIRTDLDLRWSGEWGGFSPYSSPLGASVQWVNTPISSYREMFGYEGMPEYLQTIFSLLASETNYPVYVHCMGGADRTGCLIFIINALLGVSLNDLMADYDLTSLAFLSEKNSSEEYFQEFIHGFDSYGEADAPLMKKVEAYLLANGVTEEQIHAVRAILLEKNQL